MQKIAKKHKNMYLCCAIRRKHIIMTYQETITTSIQPSEQRPTKRTYLPLMP